MQENIWRLEEIYLNKTQKAQNMKERNVNLTVLKTVNACVRKYILKVKGKLQNMKG